MPYAAALSEHPLAAHAVGEAAGDVLDRLGAGVDLAALFVTPPHVGALEDIVAAVRTLLRPGVLLGATACAVVGGEREVEDTPALSIWAGRLPGRATAVRLEARQTADGWEVEGLDDEAAARASTLIVQSDPFSFPVGPFLDDLRRAPPGAHRGRRHGLRGTGTGRQPPRARRCDPRRRSRRCPPRRRRQPHHGGVAGLPAGRPSVHRHPSRAQRALRAGRASCPGAAAGDGGGAHPGRPRPGGQRPALRHRHRRAQARLRARRLPHPWRDRRRSGGRCRRDR